MSNWYSLLFVFCSLWSQFDIHLLDCILKKNMLYMWITSHNVFFKKIPSGCDEAFFMEMEMYLVSGLLSNMNSEHVPEGYTTGRDTEAMHMYILWQWSHGLPPLKSVTSQGIRCFEWEIHHKGVNLVFLFIEIIQY